MDIAHGLPRKMIWASSAFMAALGSEHYIVMVDPGSFIDVIPFGSWPIEVTIIGTMRNVVVASSADLPSDVLQHIQQERSITHFNKDGSIYNARPFPELGITIVTTGVYPAICKNPAPPSADLAPGRYSYRLAHRRLCFAYFAPLTVAPITSCRTLSSIGTSKSTINQLSLLKTGKVVGAEALARWQQADGSYLSPEIFVALAHETGLDRVPHPVDY